MKIRVECYAGRKADEHPVKFWLGDVVLFVEPVEEWCTPEAVYFRVLADDGNTYVLAHKETNDEWTLESFRSHDSPGASNDLCVTHDGVFIDRLRGRVAKSQKELEIAGRRRDRLVICSKRPPKI